MTSTEVIEYSERQFRIEFSARQFPIDANILHTFGQLLAAVAPLLATWCYGQNDPKPERPKKSDLLPGAE